jgi:hypothetical protein
VRSPSTAAEASIDSVVLHVRNVHMSNVLDALLNFPSPAPHPAAPCHKSHPRLLVSHRMRRETWTTTTRRVLEGASVAAAAPTRVRLVDGVDGLPRRRDFENDKDRDEITLSRASSREADLAHTTPLN